MRLAKRRYILLGSRRWMAAQLGKAGGKAASDAKSAALRANGKLGGRPQKEITRGGNTKR